ncbi:MAG: flagellar FliJ family protein, partial [Bacillota bacterium]
KLQEMNKKQQNLYNYIRKDLQSVERALQARQFLQYNRRKIQNQRQKLNVKRKEVEEKQEEMVKKQKKRKVLEKLKDKKYHQFQKDFMHDLQKKLDEVGQQSYMKEGV